MSWTTSESSSSVTGSTSPRLFMYRRLIHTFAFGLKVGAGVGVTAGFGVGITEGSLGSKAS